MERDQDQQVQSEPNPENQVDTSEMTAEQIEEQKKQSALLDSIQKKGQNSVSISGKFH
jgi:hypothetical protein